MKNQDELNNLTNQEIRETILHLQSILDRREKNLLNIFIGRDVEGLKNYLISKNYDLYHDLDQNIINKIHAQLISFETGSKEKQFILELKKSSSWNKICASNLLNHFYISALQQPEDVLFLLDNDKDTLTQIFSDYAPSSYRNCFFLLKHFPTHTIELLDQFLAYHNSEFRKQTFACKNMITYGLEKYPELFTQEEKIQGYYEYFFEYDANLLEKISLNSVKKVNYEIFIENIRSSGSPRIKPYEIIKQLTKVSYDILEHTIKNYPVSLHTTFEFLKAYENTYKNNYKTNEDSKALYNFLILLTQYQPNIIEQLHIYWKEGNHEKLLNMKKTYKTFDKFFLTIELETNLSIDSQSQKIIKI